MFDNLKELGEFLVVVVNFRWINYSRRRGWKIPSNPFRVSLRLTRISKGSDIAHLRSIGILSLLPTPIPLPPVPICLSETNPDPTGPSRMRGSSEGLGVAEGNGWVLWRKPRKVSDRARIQQMRKCTELAGCVKCLQARAWVLALEKIPVPDRWSAAFQRLIIPEEAAFLRYATASRLSPSQSHTDNYHTTKRCSTHIKTLRVPFLDDIYTGHLIKSIWKTFELYHSMR